MPLPNSQDLKVQRLSQIFNNTSATYKFYWFLSFLEIHVRCGKDRISFWEIISEMIAHAWYPIHYFRLSFGKSDSLYAQAMEIQQKLSIPIDASMKCITDTLTDNLDNNKSYLRVFALNVPFRFLSPWIKYTNDKDVVKRSQVWENDCPYAIFGEEIVINPLWKEYFAENYAILRDFAYWNLTTFIQKRNPNVPDVSSKIVKPIQRDALTKQHKFWDQYISTVGEIQCIYTGKIIEPNNYDLDHFVPWSFVSHNQLWNLIPADSSINSSKSNNLPILDIYLVPFAKLQQNALKMQFERDPNNMLLEDYLTIHGSIQELIDCSEEQFINIYKKTLSPLVQIAENMGFNYWTR